MQLQTSSPHSQKPSQISPSSSKFIYYMTSNALYLRSILILPYNLCIGLPNALFPSGFPTKITYSLLSYPIRATCPFLFVDLHFLTLRISGEKCRASSIYSSPRQQMGVSAYIHALAALFPRE